MKRGVYDAAAVHRDVGRPNMRSGNSTILEDICKAAIMQITIIYTLSELSPDSKI